MSAKRSGFGREVFPVSGKAGRRMGRTPFRYCQCGFPNDTRTTAWANGANDGDGGVVFNPDSGEHEVKMGCAFCGRVRWTKTKTQALPDDENLPSRDWLRRKRNQIFG